MREDRFPGRRQLAAKDAAASISGNWIRHAQTESEVARTAGEKTSSTQVDARKHN